MRRTAGRCVLLSCHYDILDWLEPDWIFDTATGQFSGRGLRRRPPFELKIYQTDGSWWPAFEKHHYLKLPRMVAAEYFVGFVEGQPVCHLAVAMASNASSLSAHALRGAAAVGAHFVDEAGLACTGAVGSSGRSHDRPPPEPFSLVCRVRLPLDRASGQAGGLSWAG